MIPVAQQAMRNQSFAGRSGFDSAGCSAKRTWQKSQYGQQNVDPKLLGAASFDPNSERW
jgi:hypothetical protein